jgi:flagellar motor switch/type III secretory pathway protein FliN
LHGLLAEALASPSSSGASSALASTLASLPRRVRLPSYSARQVALLNHLLGVSAISHVKPAKNAGRDSVWRWRPARAATSQIVCELEVHHGDERCLLRIENEGSTVVDASVELEPFEGEALALAAVVRYAPVLEHLHRMTAKPWQCRRAVRSPSTKIDAVCELAFELELEGDPRALSGGVQLLAPGVSWLAVQGEPRPLPWCRALELYEVPVDLQLTQPLTLQRAELQALLPGAALLLGSSTHARECTLRLAQGVTLVSARLVGAHAVEVVALPSEVLPVLTRSSRMDSSASKEESESKAGLPSRFDDLPVDLEFSLGGLSIKLAELPTKLVPGAVLELQRPLGEDSVSIRAGNRELAVGELVEVGELLAVRITRVAKDGSQ